MFVRKIDSLSLPGEIRWNKEQSQVRSCRNIPILIAVGIILSSCAFPVPGKGVVDPQSAISYLAHGIQEMEAADALRRQKSPMPVMGGIFSWPPDLEKWLEHLQEAEADFRKVLNRYPTSPEAAEAQFLLGMINDHLYRNRFDVAVFEYKQTISRFPETAAAEKAIQRIAIIEAIRK